MFQAYYGPRVAVPAYFNSAVAPGHTPHPYMWGPQVFTRQKCFCFSCWSILIALQGNLSSNFKYFMTKFGPLLPQPMVPPYGTPYAAIYAHGGVYAHPGVPIVSLFSQSSISMLY